MSRTSTSSVSSSSTFSTRQPPFGTSWNKDDHTMLSPSSTTLASPAPAPTQYTLPPRAAHISIPPPVAASPKRKQDDMLAQFFGGGRHSDDATLIEPPLHTRSYSSRTDLESLPPYSEQTGMAPRSVARQFFLYGFLFPPLWLLGTSLLFIPLRTPPQWSSTKTVAEQTLLLADIREEDVKWAKRCLLALFTFIIVIVIVVFTVIRFD